MSDANMDRRNALKLLGLATAASVIGATRVDPAPSDIKPFEVHVSDEALEDLRRRLAMTRFPGDSPGDPWEYGTDREYLKELIAYWKDEYDWRAHEAKLNEFDHYTTTIDGQMIHFVHQKGRGKSPLAILMTHGWPGTIWEMLPSVPRLSDPAAHGGSEADSFDVVVPSIPGFGFSGLPREGTNMRITADLWAKLMTKLGYQRFGAYGSDWGIGVTHELGARHADRVVGVIAPGRPPQKRREPETEEERAYVESVKKWSVDETGYQKIQGTKPQTLSFGLTDSPVGLAAWITEKLQSWSDCDGDVEKRFSKDQILTLLSIYWHTRTIGTSVRYYHANGFWRTGVSQERRGEIRVPQGYVEFIGIPSQLRPPRSFLREPSDNVTHWSTFDTGGHFPAIEEPKLFVGDLRKFFRPLRSK